MKKFAIIGGGQCGLHLAFGLLDRGHDVTLYNDRNPEQLLASRIQSTAFLFNRTLEMERRLGLNFWEHEAPLGEGMLVDFRDPGGKSMLSVAGRLHEKSGQALDQRTKFARWMQEFERRGGKLVIRTVSLDELEQVAAEHTLTFIAAGKGAVNALFERDAERSRHHTPPRQLAALLLRGPKLLGERPGPRPTSARYASTSSWAWASSSRCRSIRIRRGMPQFPLRSPPRRPDGPLRRCSGWAGDACRRRAGAARVRTR